MQKFTSYILLLLLLIFLGGTGISYGQNSFGWNKVGNGFSGNVNALTVFNGSIIAGGDFDSSGNTIVKNIARWTGAAWEPLGNGLNDRVYALAVYNGKLIAGGKFEGTGSLSHVAQWDGISWTPLGVGLNDEVYALTVWNGYLVAGGKFDGTDGSGGNQIAKWNGSVWSSVGSTIDDEVYALTVYNTDLIAGGKFNVGNLKGIAKYNGSSWSALGTGVNSGEVHALTIFNSQLVVGGKFQSAGSNLNAENIATWNGSTWGNLRNGFSNEVLALTVYRNELIAGGHFDFANRNVTDTFLVNNIARWDGSDWNRMRTGTNNDVLSLAVKDSILFVGGKFNYASTKYTNNIGTWSREEVFKIAGTTRYKDNGNLITTGKVFLYHINEVTRELTVVDSANVDAAGRYSITNASNNRAVVIIRPDDELDFVPTYYPESIQWENAIVITPTTNLDSINIKAERLIAATDFFAGTISGNAILNYDIPGVPNGNGLPYKSDAIVYAKSNNVFRGFGISNTLQTYTIPALPDGSYQLIINRIGYESETRDVLMSGGVLTSNFTLDTVKFSVGVVNISLEIPDNFTLHQNYPNPFNPSTKIRFDLLKNSEVSLTVYNISGKETGKLLNRQVKSAGTYEVEFTALNLPSGVYFYRLETFELGGLSPGFIETKKMILVK